MICFFSADAGIPIRNRQVVRAWLKALATRHKHHVSSLNYVFCSDEYLLEMNRSFLKHDYYTDIITFPIDNILLEVNAECYVSVDRVRENAVKIGVTFEEELNRVMAHGLLHLIGYGDKSNEQEAEMRKQENDALLQWAFHVEQFKLTKVKKGSVPRGTLE